jgi:predicted nucleotidyltransferase
MTKPDFGSLLRILVERGVDFLVVGGVGAVLQGASLSTFDLDIVHSMEPANIARLLAALGDLDACYRAQPEKRLRPSQTHLSSPEHRLLMTRFGPLDVLGSIGKGRRYQDLLPHAAEMTIEGGIPIRVLNLETQIAVKEEIGQEKDMAALPLLRRALEESRRKHGSK